MIANAGSVLVIGGIKYNICGYLGDRLLVTRAVH